MFASTRGAMQVLNGPGIVLDGPWALCLTGFCGGICTQVLLMDAPLVQGLMAGILGMVPLSSSPP